jgi:hypothetical protein
MGKRPIVSVLVLASGAGLAALWLAWPRERLLIDRATKAADARRWQHNAYFWLSDHELLLFKKRPDDPIKPVRFNLMTQQEEPVDPLYAALKREASGLTGGRWLHMQNVSPDGKWLLCKGGQAFGPPIAACSLEGKATVRSGIEGLWGHWLVDSSGWLEQAAIHPHEVIKFQPVRGSVRAIHLSGLPEVFDLIGCQEDGTVLLYSSADMQRDPANRGRLRWYAAPASGGPVRSFNGAIPTWVREFNPYVSPRGTHILWVFFPFEPPRAATLVGRIRGWLGLRRKNQPVGYWVSRADGSNMHELGNVFEEFGYAPTDSLRWTPDESHISFIYKNALYTVPVD